DNPLAAMAADRSSQLGMLLGAWGVDFNAREIIGDLSHGMSVSMRAGEAPTRHIAILGLDATSLAADDVVTNGLGSIHVATAGYLAPRDGADTLFEPLLQSSALAAPLPVERFAMLMDPASLQDGFEPTGQRYALAARVTGHVKSAFPDGPGPLRDS